MKFRLLNDFLYSMVASALPILVLQFVILPLTANSIGSIEYGLLIALISWVNMFSITLGNVLNNIRLIENDFYKKKDIKGDFNIILFIFVIINIVLVTIGLIYLNESANLLNLLLLVLTSVFLLIKGYLIVGFRLKLRFDLILVDSAIILIGYIVGYVLFKITGEWSFIYLISSILSLSYIILKTNLINEPFRRTLNFKNISRKTTLLLISVLLNSITIYLDKIMLLPLLGGTAVTIYYISSIMGKTFSLILNPISNVILSYLSRMSTLKDKLFSSMLIVSLVIGGISYFIVLYISEIILEIIYPDYVIQAMVYLPVTILTAIILSITGVLNPIILKFMHTKWQVYINSIYLMFYIILSLTLLNKYGLIGFCYGLLIAAIIKLILVISVYNFSTKKYR